ncbi:TetR family transcriptional regulator C-terminal domain-containing protein [Polycladidibacter hongkongensis]|uniref:TetR family transcriptional regulator C-terminal domain-containing protein n=1 Tax=Polycladidibacter hongkongensis TaxID=1647556 RepID=UPI000832E5CB|nr:TetR family transcriptional regulator C-terminal domain-containing protein [Pseudovibrio hongkongensis]
MARASDAKTQTRIQREKKQIILEAALEVFSAHGYKGATLEQIANQSNLSKPNLLYYFDSKEGIFQRLIEELLVSWLDPLRKFSATGNPVEEICAYVQRKLEMARDYPRESRLFATEIIQGAKHIHPQLAGPLKQLVDDKAEIIEYWAHSGAINPVDPYHLLFSIWSTTQHYADFSSQVNAILGHNAPNWFVDASAHLDRMFRAMLTPPTKA